PPLTTSPTVTSASTTEPSDSRSPTFTAMSLTTPPSGAGTSIVALSDYSVISASSAFTVSPALTSTSITGMSLNSPMSGTRTSATPAGELVGAGGADTEVFGASAGGVAAPTAEVSSKMTLPSLTLSPSLTFSSFPVP